MRPATIRTCEACGFENAEVGVACALCGSSEVIAPTVDLPTLAAPTPSAGRSAASPGLSPGDIVGSRYRIESLLGSGGMGQVFRACDTQGGPAVALKVLLPLDQGQEDRARRFRREIEVLRRVQHPAVLHISDWGTSDGRLYLVTELVEGEDLKLAIRRRGPFPPAEAAALGATLAEALAAAHAQGVIHRDVKPNNVMIATDGSLRLLDFGLARGAGVDVTSLTRTGTILGTPAYMSPEQFEDAAVDERSDIYSLGVVLFEVLTGQLPFKGTTAIAVGLAHRTEPPPLLRSVRPGLPAWLERVVLRCLEKDPGRRFASADVLAAELSRPRAAAHPRSRALPSGDHVVLDEGELGDWALVLRSPREKSGWSEGMALRFEDRYYRLVDDRRGAGANAFWEYRFSPWPAGEIFRRLVDYEQDCAERAGKDAQRIGSRLSRWLGRGE
jgi:serine/threonine protein kinase